MADKPWKKAERQLAALFGAKRRPLSGMTHATHQTGGDDAEHPTLFIEAKYTASSASPYVPSIALVDSSKSKASKEGKKAAIVGLRKYGDQNLYLLCNSRDLETILTAYCDAQGYTLIR